MEDYQIIALFGERSEKAITAVTERYGSYCRYIANNILHNKEDVEECINERKQNNVLAFSDEERIKSLS